MGTLAQSLSQSLAQSLAQSLSPRLTYLDPYLLNHTCNLDDRTVSYDGGFLSGVAANDPAIVAIDGILMVQIEEAGENLCKYSQIFETGSSDWSNNALQSITDNSTIAPDGTMTGCLIVENTNTVAHQLQKQTIPVTATEYYTWSFFVKAKERTHARIQFNGSGNLLSAVIFDIENGTVTDTTGTYLRNYHILHVGSEWYRISMTVEANATGNAWMVLGICEDGTTSNYTGDGTSGLYVWGAQSENKRWASSYTPTTTTSEVRPLVEAYWDSADVPDWVLSGDWKQIFIPYGSRDECDGLYMLSPRFSSSAYHRFSSSDIHSINDAVTGYCCQINSTDYERYDTLVCTAKHSVPSLKLEINSVEFDTDIGTAWVWTPSNLDFGHNATPAYHCNGLLSPPIKL